MEHSQPAAYCVAGRHPTVILTTGAVQALHPGQLDAVLAHERAHLTGRHHRLLAVARIGRQVLPFLPLMRDTEEQVARLVELHADDAATRAHDPAVARHRPGPARHGGQSGVGPGRGCHRLGAADPPAPGPLRATGPRPPAAAARHRRGADPDPGTAGPDPGCAGPRTRDGFPLPSVGLPSAMNNLPVGLVLSDMRIHRQNGPSGAPAERQDNITDAPAGRLPLAAALLLVRQVRPAPAGRHRR